MTQVSFDVEGKVTSIQIVVESPIVDPDKPLPRLVLEGILKDTTTGQPVKRFTEDVTDLLNATEKGRVTAIVTRAQAWVDNKVG